MIEKVISIIQAACALEENINLESELVLLSLDSISFVEMIVELEEYFEVEFEIDELSIFDWKTVGDIIRTLKEKVYAKK